MTANRHRPGLACRMGVLSGPREARSKARVAYPSRKRRRSHTRAVAHSRLTVAGDSAIAWAISSIVSPAK